MLVFYLLQSDMFSVPGPMTVMDGCYNSYYQHNDDMLADIVNILQREVLALVANGCKHVIIDEPALVYYPEKALQHGVEDIEKIFAACPDDVRKEIILTDTDLDVPVDDEIIRKLD